MIDPALIRPFRSSVFVACAILSAVIPQPSLLGQSNTLRLEFEGDPSRSTTISAFRQQGVLYCSLNDLADAFSLGTYENGDARKFELKRPPFRLTVSGGNPYVIVVDQAQRRTIHQLQARVIHATGGYFVPVISFVQLFNGVFGMATQFDPTGSTLRVLTPPKARGYDFSTLHFEQKVNGMLIRIPATRPLPDIESWLRQDGWFYVTIADARVDVEALSRLKPVGMVRKIVPIQSPSSVQLSFKLSGKIAATEIVRHEGSNEIFISIRTPGEEEKVLLASKRREILAGLEQQRKRWELDVIVIDPGHGGKDHGATGVTGVKEKDITLAVSLKLGKLIGKHMPGVKVVYTRSDDRFIELDRRGKIANEAEGKLFISIHCNSLKRKPSDTRGFEVYLLRPGRTEEAMAIAERENSVIRLEEGYEERYKKLTEENFILLTMAQSAYVKASELFADISQQEMDRHLDVPNRGVKQAGFFVLVGASMPNVLVETAYLSNRTDERYLASNAGQQKFAEALLSAIKRYKEEYEKLLLEGKEIGER